MNTSNGFLKPYIYQKVSENKMTNTMDFLRFCTQSENSIGAECLVCGRILKVDKANLRETFEGYALITPITCECTRTYQHISGKSLTFKVPSTPVAA